ncbi:hypothetical protein KY289_007238 [Solanum tuberosum]|nr:hypothetical protein KY289_007238 [Solanum tuberosum]
MTKLDLGIMTRIMELWGMKAENQKQDCIKGVTEMEKQDSEMENQDLITEEDDLHHINKKQKMDSEMENQDLIAEMEDLHSQGADEDESTGGRGASGHVVHV